MSLQAEIERGAKQIATDGYPMSIGELVNLYRDRELDLHPEFQRFFRWKLPQKSRLMESILLGIPLPSIFVFQRKDGVWDVIDGVQRLSTIFEFMGELRDEHGTAIQATSFLKTRYLPALEGKYWAHPDESKSLTDGQRRLIKRAKLDIKIVKSGSSDASKYELFDRLNTGGTLASDQEVRNCLLIMTNREMFRWLESLATDPNFRTCTALTERQLEERYDLELILRFMILKDLSGDDLRFEDLGIFLTERTLALAAPESTFNQDEAGSSFLKTFAALANSALEDDAFRKYDAVKGKFQGPFYISAFEAIAFGLGHNFSVNQDFTAPADLADRVRRLWQNPQFLDNSGSGIRASLRIPRIIPLGREFFA